MIKCPDCGEESRIANSGLKLGQQDPSVRLRCRNCGCIWSVSLNPSSTRRLSPERKIPPPPRVWHVIFIELWHEDLSQNGFLAEHINTHTCDTVHSEQGLKRKCPFVFSGPDGSGLKFQYSPYRAENLLTGRVVTSVEWRLEHHAQLARLIESGGMPNYTKLKKLVQEKYGPKPS